MIVVCDLDNCLSDSRWRDHMIESIPDGKGRTPDQFVEYNLLAEQDLPNESVAWMIRMLKADLRCEVWIATSRPERNRELTVRWLSKHSIPWDRLLMRPNGELCPSPLLKTSEVILHLDGKPMREEVSLVIDDRPDVIEAFRALGVTTLLVNPAPQRGELVT